MGTKAEEMYKCQHCGAEADMTIEGLESVQDVIKREKKTVCKSCGKEIDLGAEKRRAFACVQCGAEADITLEGFENVGDVVKRTEKLSCSACGQDLPRTEPEDLKAVHAAMEAEKEASQFYLKASKKTRNPKGKNMFEQLSQFEANHYQKLKELSESLRQKNEWILYPGTTLKKKAIPLKTETPRGQDQLSDMDALKTAIREEKKAQSYYRSMAELTRDPRGKDMYKRLAEEEALHEKVLNDQYYSVHNTGFWSWGD